MTTTSEPERSLASHGNSARVSNIEVRQERDGRYRYVASVGTQTVVSRETYETSAEALRAAQASIPGARETHAVD